MRIKSITYLFFKATNELEESQARLENVDEFKRAIIHFESEKKGDLATFLDEVALLQEQASKQDEQHDTLALMTLHAAKGLEFDTVILAGLEEGLLPSSRSLHDNTAIEEERRLFYVGITRARERLLLSKSRYRYSFGQMSDQYPSSFLREIPEKLIFAHDLCYMQPYNVKQLFAQWLGSAAPSEPTIMTFGTPAHTRPKVTVTTPPAKPVRSYAAPKPSSYGPEKLAPANTAPSASGWKINQPVKHATFGIGLVKKVEEQGSKVSLTVNFGTQIKKILASFVTKV